MSRDQEISQDGLNFMEFKLAAGTTNGSTDPLLVVDPLASLMRGHKDTTKDVCVP